MKFTNPILQKVEGTYAALYTPFNPDGSLNEAMIEKTVDYGMKNGLTGFYLTGNTGEGMLLDRDEHIRVWKRVRATAPKAVLIAHVGAMSTADAVWLAKAAENVGCDWLSSIWPFFYGRGFEAAYRYYETLSNATGLPFMAYACGTEIVPQRDAKIFSLKNVLGMKYTGHSAWNVKRLQNCLNKEVAFFAGADEQALNSMSLRDCFCGSIGTSQNTIPRHFVELKKAIDSGDMARANLIQDEIVRFVDIMLGAADDNGSWHKAMIKWAGFDCGAARAPNGWELPAEQYAELCRRLDDWKAASKI